MLDQMHPLLVNPIALIFLSYNIDALYTSAIRGMGKISVCENRNYISDSLTKKLVVLPVGLLSKKCFKSKFNQKHFWLCIPLATLVGDYKTLRQLADLF